MTVDQPIVHFLLGFETSRDETGVGTVRGTQLLADAVATSVDEHARFEVDGAKERFEADGARESFGADGVRERVGADGVRERVGVDGVVSVEWVRE